ncbi:MAG: hypothetical protein A3D31_15715 [Candidatus Fluviicola riflensis]|nr:MAG: hypothetical protein CHH17_00650 [Candidatus Fluviicola riflensis]OGS78406.1 MAG: hypothetical protein A3D31_15715 [Candidatus Fluviicola riflensis]OGS85472.1 MAG: hypothetical protein A2724_12650 [Fluviicola sp. RIFCSPHIGHO2_01_FULL_43_53]OGS87513.1 MAG: hypothetical protein A3E30_09070 [Fluviicola sp. RIFCSPHIGHO2_12_FULL_43_24]
MKASLLFVLLLIANGNFAQTADSVYTIVDHQAEFPGGSSEMKRWMADNLTFPPSLTEEDNLISHISVSFVVELDGRLTEIRVLRGGDQAANRHIAGIIKSMPHWKPATLNGKAVRSRYHLSSTICLK